MIINESQKEFELVTGKIKKILGWEVESRCPNCNAILREDAFEVIHFLGGVKNWVCPNCVVEKHDGEWVEHRVGCWNHKLTFPPDFYKDLQKYEQLFLEGYLIGLYHFFPVKNPLSEIKVFSDLSIAIPRLYSAIEVFLQETILSKSSLEALVKEGCGDPKENEVNANLKILKSLGVKFDKKIKREIMKAGRIRNKIVHRGYSPNIVEYLFVFEYVGVNIAYIQKNN